MDDNEIENFSSRVLRGYARKEEIDDFWIWQNYTEMKQEHQCKFIEIIGRHQKNRFLSDEANTKLQELKIYLESGDELPF